MTQSQGTLTIASVLALAVGGVAAVWYPQLREGSHRPDANRTAPEVADTVDEHIAALLAKSRRKEVVVRELAAGRVSLVDAVQRVLAIEVERPELWAMTRRLLEHADPAPTIEESVARNLVRRALDKVGCDPARHEALSDRLEAELVAFPTTWTFDADTDLVR